MPEDLADETVGADTEHPALVEVANFPPLDGPLSMLVYMVNDTQYPGGIEVTLYLGAGVLCGTLISRAEWTERWAEQLGPNTPELRDLLKTMTSEAEAASDEEDRKREERNLPPVPRHSIYLKDTTLIQGGGAQVRAPLWHGRLSQIDGWSMGSYEAEG